MAAIKGQPAPKPSSVAASVPGKSAEDEAAEYLAQFSAPSVNAPASPEEEEAQQFLAAERDAEITQMEETSNALGQGAELIAGAGDMAARALDYGGGLVRTGAAAVAAAASGKEGVVGKEDVKAAAKGKAPVSAEYLRRLGVPEGGSMDLPGFGKVTVRGATGLAADIATDPLTAISKLAKNAPYIKKLINLPGAGMEALGEAAYRSAFSKVDQKLVEKGKGKLSDVMLEGGAPMMTQGGIAKKTDDIANVMGKLRQGLYDKATELGVTIDTGFPLKRAESTLAAMKKDPGLRPAAEELQSLLDRYKAEGKVTIEQISDWKTSLYDALPNTAFGPHGTLKGPAKQFKAALAADFRQLILDAGNKAEKGLGDSIDVINNKWGTLINAQKVLAKGGPAADSLGRKIDGAVAAIGGVKGYAVKKGYDMAVSPLAKTVVGKALMGAGKSDMVNRLIQRGFVNTQLSPEQKVQEVPQEELEE